MKLLLNLLLALSVFAASGIVDAQPLDFQRSVDPFRVADFEGNRYLYPFVGGFNAPRHQLLDIDGDGDDDLFIQEREHELIFFENSGSSDEAVFKWITDSFMGIDIGTWYVFADADNDNDYDLFCRGPIFGLIRYLENEGDSKNPVFTVKSDSLKDDRGETIFATFTSPPTLADVNCDELPDLFVGDPNGTISYFSHDGMDADNVPRFVFREERFEELLILTGGTRKRDADPTQRHGSNAFSFADIDGDGAAELFWGDLFTSRVLIFRNVGSCEDIDLDTNVRFFPEGSPIETSGYNVPRFSDIDRDGDLDFFLSVLGGTTPIPPSDLENIHFYRNVGDENTPDYQLQTRQYLSCIDVGDFSVPAFYDLDADGDLDVLIGSENRIADPDNGRLMLYDNEGSKRQPALRLINTDFQTLRVGSKLSPALADIDNDKDADLLLGIRSGEILSYINEGDPQTPFFVESGGITEGIDVGSSAAPALVDIDDDGDFDLFIGEFSGNLNFYRNDGSAESPNFVLEVERYLDIDVGRSSIPTFCDIDGDEDFDLFIGSEEGGINFWRNTGTVTNPQFEPDEGFAPDVHLNAAPAFGDIDDDGDEDFVAGGVGGGLLFFENRRIVNSLDDRHDDRVAMIRLQLMPVPAASTLVLRLSPSKPDGLVPAGILSIHSLLGTELKSWTIPGASGSELRWQLTDRNGNSVPPGVYVCRFASPTGKLLQAQSFLVSD